MSPALGWDIGTIVDFATSEAGRTILEAKSTLEELHKHATEDVDATLGDATAAYGSLRTSVETVPIRALDAAARHISNVISDQMATVDTTLGRAALNLDHLNRAISNLQAVQAAFGAPGALQQVGQNDYRYNQNCVERYNTYQEAEARLREFFAWVQSQGGAGGGAVEWFVETDASGNRRVYYCPKGFAVIPTAPAVPPAPQPVAPTPQPTQPGPTPPTGTGSQPQVPTPQPTQPEPTPTTDTSFQPQAPCDWMELGPFDSYEKAEQRAQIIKQQYPNPSWFEYHISPREQYSPTYGFAIHYYVVYRYCPPAPSPAPTAPKPSPTTPPGTQCPAPQYVCPPPVINVDVTCPGASVSHDVTSAKPTDDTKKEEEALTCSIPSLQRGCLVVHYEESSDANILVQRAETIIATLKIANKSKKYSYTIANCRKRYALIICEDTSVDGLECPDLYQDANAYMPKPEYLVTSLPDANDESCKRLAPLGGDFWRLAVYSQIRVESDGWFFEKHPEE